MVTQMEVERHEIEKMKLKTFQAILEQLKILNNTMTEMQQDLNYLTPLADLKRKI